MIIISILIVILPMVTTVDFFFVVILSPWLIPILLIIETRPFLKNLTVSKWRINLKFHGAQQPSLFSLIDGCSLVNLTPYSVPYLVFTSIYGASVLHSKPPVPPTQLAMIHHFPAWSKCLASGETCWKIIKNKTEVRSHLGCHVFLLCSSTTPGHLF